jgi:hypothetical protein
LCVELVELNNQLNDPEVLKEAVQVITTIDSCISDNGNYFLKELVIMVMCLVVCVCKHGFLFYA